MLFRDTNDKRKRDDTDEDEVEAQIAWISDRHRRCDVMAKAAEERKGTGSSNEHHMRISSAPFENLPVMQYLEMYDEDSTSLKKARVQ